MPESFEVTAPALTSALARTFECVAELYALNTECNAIITENQARIIMKEPLAYQKIDFDKIAHAHRAVGLRLREIIEEQGPQPNA